MIGGVEFSRRGEKPTDFEAKLIACAKSDHAWVMVAQRLVTVLGRDAGILALALVLDELADEKVRVPSRRHFFARLWRSERDALIHELSSRRDGRWSDTDLSHALGISRTAVRNIRLRKEAPRGARVSRRP